MKKSQIIWVIIGVIGVGLGILYLLQPERYNWWSMYQPDSDEPFGLSIFKEVLEESVCDDCFEFNTVPFNEVTADEDSLFSGTYFYIGSSPSMGTEAIDSLLNFVERGNTAFLSLSYLPYHIHDTLFKEGFANTQYETSYDSSFIELYLRDYPNRYPVKLTHEVRDTVETYQFFAFNRAAYRSDSLVYHEPGYFNNERVNFLRIEWGEGQILLHSTPLVFTNLHMLDSANFAYVSDVLSYIPDGPIHWDYSYYVNYDRGRNYDFSEGPLDYLLSQPALKAAWYLTLGLVALYLIFNTKRRQRIIPLVTANRNSSLDFVETIGHLYYADKNNRKIALKERELFFYHLRKKLRLNPSMEDPNFPETLADKANIPLKMAQSIMNKSIALETPQEISEEFLAGYHQLIKEFYDQVN